MNDFGEYLRVIRQIHNFRDRIRKSDPSRLPLAILDSWLGHLGKASSVETRSCYEIKRRKLDGLLTICKTKDAEDYQLQIAVMEVPALASPEDGESVAILSKLVEHPDKYVRINACKSIGLLGGEEAKRILGDIQKSPDPIVRHTVSQVMMDTEMLELAAKLQVRVWRNGAVDSLIRLAVRPYKRAIRSVGLMLFLVTIELLTAVAFVVWRTLE